MSKQTKILNKYEITSQGSNLSVTMLKSSFDRVIDSGASNENYMNLWLDENQERQNEIEVNTILDNSTSTLSDYKDSLVNDLSSYRDEIIPIVESFLCFAYAVELGKQWDTPFDPLNVVYDEQENQIKAFIRKSTVKKQIDKTFIDQVLKIVTYLYYPVKMNDSDYHKLSYEDIYSDFNEKYDIDKQDPDPEVQAIFDDEEKIIFDLYDIYLNDAHDYQSVRDILSEIGRDDLISEVEDSESVTNSTIPRNVTSFLDSDDNEDQDLDNLSPKDKRRSEYEKAKADKKSNKSKSGGHPFIKILLTLILLSMLGYAGYTYLMKPSKSEQTSSVKTSSSNNDPLSNKSFKKGIADAGAQQYEKASNEFDKAFSDGVTSSMLDSSETSAVFSSYLNVEEYQKILDNIESEETGTALVNYLILNKKQDKIKELNSDLPIIIFAKADLSKDYQTMVDQANSVDISKNDQFKNDLTNAFAQTNQLKAGKEWAETQENSQDLINAIKGHAMSMPNANKEEINKELG